MSHIIGKDAENEDSRHINRYPLDQRITDAIDEFEGGRKSGLSQGWHRGWLMAYQHMNECEAAEVAGKSEPATPPNPYNEVGE